MNLALAILIAVLALGLVYWIGRDIAKRVQVDVVHEWQRGLLYRNGRFVGELEPGIYRRFAMLTRWRVETVRIAQRQIEPKPEDVSTKDRLPVRIGAQVLFSISSARTFFEGAGETLIRNAIRTALAELAATTDLADLQHGRRELDARLTELIGQPDACCVLHQAQITQIGLPPETRRMLIEVERARLEGLAALQRARGEQAALRALANAARLMKDNPELAQLRTLQAIQASKGSTTLVISKA